MDIKIKKIKIDPTYKKENQLWVLNFDDIKVPFIVKEKSIVYILPKKLGGNHFHPRQEAFIGIGEGLELHYLKENIIKKERMNPDGKLFLFVIPANLPHAVFNNSNSPAIIIEFADGKQEGVQNYKLI
ncbi:MAG: hypothetical protein Fur009_8280 [Candidatus Microgenomates bacterium]